MNTTTAASLVNLLGFITGIVLYVMLLWMVLNSRPASNRLLVLTGLLGFAWNMRMTSASSEPRLLHSRSVGTNRNWTEFPFA